MKTERELKLEAALERAELALADWVNTYAPEFCDENNVRRARSRIEANGGTLAYIADVVECVREAIADEDKGRDDWMGPTRMPEAQSVNTTTADKLRRRLDWEHSSRITDSVAQEGRLIRDADRLAAIEPDYNNAMALIRMRGVPEQRAEHLTHALDVLLTRLDREIQSHRVVESAIERQARELITKWRDGVPVWDGPRDQNGEIIEEDARWHNYPALADECADDLEAILDPPEG